MENCFMHRNPPAVHSNSFGRIRRVEFIFISVGAGVRIFGEKCTFHLVQRAGGGTEETNNDDQSK